ncbi:MAG: hydrogenase expression/formation protein HypE [Clostridiales bacterium]|nr:hydrogenase expression/formation protein HypE [Clostridiales bacterium]
MKITMAHGSGGKSSAQLMSDIFGKYFKNQILDKMEDAAVLSVNGKIACSTDSFVVTPLVFKGGDIGKLCVCGTVNDLLMMGAVPKYLTCGFILEEGLETNLLDRIVCSMAKQAQEAGVVIVAGDTKVVEGNGGLFINTTGIGEIPEARDVSSRNCKPGDVIILSGNLGEHHACILSHRMGIENNIKSDCAALNDIVDALFDGGIHVKTMRDVTRGGLGTVLNEIADSSACKIDLEEERIPVLDEVRGFADIMGLDPLYMGNEGKMIAVVPAEEAGKALDAVKSCSHGAEAAIIGQIMEGKGTFIKTKLGATRRFDVLYGEGLPRIC